jgi:uncharacterized protein
MWLHLSSVIRIGIPLIDVTKNIGSVLRDDFTPLSDMEMLVEFERDFTPGFFKLYQIQEELSDLFGNKSIDLVTPKFLNQHIRDRVLAEAQVCYVAKR